jgi:predicted metal-binding membrane protein
MMVGMMSPAAVLGLLIFAAAQSKRSKSFVLSTTTMFALGYIAIWAGFGVVTAFSQWDLHQAATVSATMIPSNPRFGTAILIAAGVDQLTPWTN